jgi:hypothetical protein
MALSLVFKMPETSAAWLILALVPAENFTAS